MNLDKLAEALRITSFRRIAVQVHDNYLSSAPEMVADLQRRLPNAIVSLLGDSVTQCCLDEVSAEHYGSDCIVKLGHTCWFASQRLVAYFVPDSALDPVKVCQEFQTFRKTNPTGAVVVFVNEVTDVSSILALPTEQIGELYIALSVCMSYPDSEYGGCFKFSRPFVSPVIYALSVRVRRIAPTIAGRLVFWYSESSFVPLLDQGKVDSLVSNLETTFILTKAGSGVYTRMVNRFGSRSDRVIATLSGVVESLPSSNYAELLRGYRGVESVKMAMNVGIVVTHCSATRELFQVRDLLSVFLRAMNKEVHIFSIGKVDGVKLGNFPEIDVFIILACPETVCEQSLDLAADCVGPFEALVAVEALDWADYIITDYDEMLAKMVSEPPPRTPRTPRTRREPKPAPTLPQAIPPAKIEMGLRGIPSRYSSEPNGPDSDPSPGH